MMLQVQTGLAAGAAAPTAARSRAARFAAPPLASIPAPHSLGGRAHWVRRSSHLVVRVRADGGQQREAEEQRPRAPLAPPPAGSSPPPPRPDGDDDEDLEQAFGVFDWPAYTRGWDVPWGAREVALGMAGWAGSFLLVGLAFFALVKAAAGPGGFAALTPQQKALAALANQAAETAAGLGVIAATVGRYGPLAPRDLFIVDPAAPFRKPDGWAAWGLLGFAAAPAAVAASAALAEALRGADPAARGTADAVTGIVAGMDAPTFAALFAVTAVLAPVLEETIFRGFLLTSLTKWMPVPAAVGASALAFGAAHLTPRDFPQLVALGVVLGFAYVRSRNLLAPMLIHGTWNGAVLAVLFALDAAGYKLEDVLHSAGGF